MNTSICGPMSLRRLNSPSAAVVSPLPAAKSVAQTAQQLNDLTVGLSQLPCSLASPESLHAARWR